MAIQQAVNLPPQGITGSSPVGGANFGPDLPQRGGLNLIEVVMYNNAIFCKKMNQIPKETHWAIILNDFYYSDSGYPEDGESKYDMLDYRAYLNKADFENAVKELVLQGKISTFQALEVRPLNIKTSMNINIQ